MRGTGNATDADWVEIDVRFRRPLTEYFSRRTRDLAEAQDLAQEVFVRLAKHPDRENGARLNAYVFTIAASVLKDWVRRRKVRTEGARNEPLDSIDAENGGELCADLVEGRDPERVLIGRETLKALLDAMDELDAKTREIFILSRIEKMDQREIGMLFGISRSTVEKHMIRAGAFLAARFRK